ncbi:hypothetical protein B0I37DRAFT_205909 [Chaetomium sp. MPI-CAGE-AT-0009]|nr:hypothetical protein B0I37DRAFT_205909 [Chaetomium sp. MPI-CAGE-AT-0009]
MEAPATLVAGLPPFYFPVLNILAVLVVRLEVSETHPPTHHHLGIVCFCSRRYPGANTTNINGATNRPSFVPTWSSWSGRDAAVRAGWNGWPDAKNNPRLDAPQRWRIARVMLQEESLGGFEAGAGRGRALTRGLPAFGNLE